MHKNTQRDLWEAWWDAYCRDDFEGALKILSLLSPYAKNKAAYRRLRKALQVEDWEATIHIVDEESDKAFPHLAFGR